MSSSASGAGPAAMQEPIPFCEPGSRADMVMREIKKPRPRTDPMRTTPLVVLLVGGCGAGKSSTIKTWQYLTEGDFSRHWSAVPRVMPQGSTAGSITSDLDFYEGPDENGQLKYVLTDMEGIEGCVGAVEEAVLGKIADGGLHPGAKVGLAQKKEPSSFYSKVSSFFGRNPAPAPPTGVNAVARGRGPDVVIIVVNLALNLAFADYRKLIDLFRERGQLPFVAVTGMEALQATRVPQKRAVRCVGQKRKHSPCNNEANPCWEHIINHELGTDAYIIEPCRDGPKYEKSDFMHYGEDNVVEMLELLRDALHDAERWQGRRRRDAY